MAGLGFANPELIKAARLAALNGSTAMPTNPFGTAVAAARGQMNEGGGQPSIPSAGAAGASLMPQTPPEDNLGVGIAARGAIGMMDAPGATTPTPPTTTPPPGEPGDHKPKWYEIAGAIGHVLLSADAGYHGQPMPANPFQDDLDEEMRRDEFVMNTAARAWEAYRNAPPEKRKQMLEEYKKIIARVAPDFDLDKFIDGMSGDEGVADAAAPEVAMMSPEAKAMFMARVRARGGDPAIAAAEVIKDTDFMNSLREYEDRRNVPVLKYKLQRIRAALVSMNMDPDTFKGMSMDDFERINAQLPESVRLSPAEIATLRRHPEMAAALGMTPQDREGEPVPDNSVEGASGYRPPQDQGRGGGQTPRPTNPSPSNPAAPPPNNAGSGSGPRPENTRPAAPRPGRQPPPPPPGGTPRPQGSRPPKPAPTRPPAGTPTRPPANTPRPTPARPPASTKPPAPAPSGTQPVSDGGRSWYPPGWQPRTPDPRRAPIPVTRVEVKGRRHPKKHREDDQKKPPAPQPTDTKKPPAPPRSGKRRVVLPKDVDIPGLGPMKKGDSVIYDYDTGQYTRG